MFHKKTSKQKKSVPQKNQQNKLFNKKANKQIKENKCSTKKPANKKTDLQNQQTKRRLKKQENIFKKFSKTKSFKVKDE